MKTLYEDIYKSHNFSIGKSGSLALEQVGPRLLSSIMVSLFKSLEDSMRQMHIKDIRYVR